MTSRRPARRNDYLFTEHQIRIDTIYVSQIVEKYVADGWGWREAFGIGHHA